MDDLELQKLALEYEVKYRKTLRGRFQTFLDAWENLMNIVVIEVIRLFSKKK